MLLCFKKIDISFFLEKDKFQNLIWSWSYPTVSSAVREAVLENSCLKSEEMDGGTLDFIFNRCENVWFYMSTSINNLQVLPDVR